MFEKASRLKLRFASLQGQLTVEDLWDLPLTTTVRQNVANLNSIAKAISRQLKSDSEEDFVNPKSQINEGLQLALDIVKYVIQVKQTESEATREAADRIVKKQRLLELIQRKQDAALEGLQLEELQAMVASL